MLRVVLFGMCLLVMCGVGGKVGVVWGGGKGKQARCQREMGKARLLYRRYIRRKALYQVSQLLQRCQVARYAITAARWARAMGRYDQAINSYATALGWLRSSSRRQKSQKKRREHQERLRECQEELKEAQRSFLRQAGKTLSGKKPRITLPQKGTKGGFRVIVPVLRPQVRPLRVKILFALGSSHIRQEGRALLQTLVALLRPMLQKKKVRVLVTGHTDRTGSLQLNQRLSLQRAQSVVRYLQGQGLPARRFQSKGLAYSQPVASNKTKEGRAQNRRVEFLLRFSPR